MDSSSHTDGTGRLIPGTRGKGRDLAFDGGDETVKFLGIRGKKAESGKVKVPRCRKNATPMRSIEMGAATERGRDVDKEEKRKTSPNFRTEEEEARGKKILEAMEQAGVVRLSLTSEQCCSDIEKINRAISKTTADYDSDTVTESSADASFISEEYRRKSQNFQPAGSSLH